MLWPAELRKSMTDPVFVSHGSEAEVFKCTHKKTGVHVAVKARPLLSKVDVEEFENEVLVTKKFGKGGDMVTFFGGFVTEKDPRTKYGLLFLRYVEGTLHDRVFDRCFEEVSLEVRLRLAVQLARGLHTLAKSGYVHRDLNRNNILISGDCGCSEGCYAKIADFGLACHVGTVRAKPLTFLAGSRLYIAPEIWLEEPPTLKNDIWSLGLIFYELMVGTLPAVLDGAAEPGTKVLDLEHDPLRQIVTNEFFVEDDDDLLRLQTEEPEIATLIRDMLEQWPEDRPTASMVLQRMEQIAARRGVVVPEAKPPRETSRLRRDLDYL